MPICFLLFMQITESDQDLLAPFRLAYWDYTLHLGNYQADERYTYSVEGEQTLEQDSIFIYYEHGFPQLQVNEFHLPNNDRFVFFKRMRAANKNDRAIAELRSINEEWTRNYANLPDITFILPNVPFLNRQKMAYFDYAVDEHPNELPSGSLLRFTDDLGHSGTLLIDENKRLVELKQWLPLTQPQNAFLSVSIHFESTPSGVLFVSKAERRATLEAQELWRDTWSWSDPRSIRPSMSLGKSLDATKPIDIELLLALSNEVSEYDRQLAQVSSIERKEMVVRDGAKTTKRTVVSEFLVVPLDRSPNERVELRIVQTVDGKKVNLQDDLIDLMSRDFSDRRDEIRRINEFSDQFDLGGSPHGFTINQAACFNDEWLGLFQHQTEQQTLGGRNFTVVTSVQTRGRGLIRGGLLAFRPKFVTYVNESGTMTRVETTYDMTRPYRTRIVIDYLRNMDQITYPSYIEHTVYRGDTIVEEIKYDYSEFEKIKVKVETQVQTDDVRN